MNTKQFSEALSNVNDKYINEALGKSTQDPRRMRRSMKVWRAIAIAACAILVAGGALAGWAALEGSSYKSADSYRDHEMSGAPSYNAYEGKNEIIFDEESSGMYAENEGSMSYYEPAAAADGSAVSPSSASDDSATTANGSDAANTPIENGLKIIYTAYINMETTQFDESVKQIEDLVKKNNAYFEMAGVSNASAYYRSASYVVRIPADQLDAFLDEVQEICTVTNMQKYAEDVSESYFDIETRLETAKTKLARLRELMAAASDMQDIITLENEISNTQYQIDNLTGTLNHYDSQISYSTVSIDLREVYKVNEENAPLTFGQHITKAFKEGLAGFGSFLEGLLIFLAGNWIWLLIVTAVVVAVIFIIRGIRKKHRK